MKVGNFTYDSRNRLTGVGNTRYGYDAENNRISVSDGVYSNQYVVNPNSEYSQTLIKTDAQGKQTFYVYGLGLIGQEEAGVYKTYHYDLRGSTVALTDINGNVTDRFQYGPYGELVYRSGTTATPFLYNGRDGVMTDSNGLYYMRARYYNPELRRFINQDVVLGSIDKGQSLNRYAYVNGNPVTFVDPFGLSRRYYYQGTGNVKAPVNPNNGKREAVSKGINTASDVATVTKGIGEEFGKPGLGKAGGVAGKGLMVLQVIDDYDKQFNQTNQSKTKAACKLYIHTVVSAGSDLLKGASATVHLSAMAGTTGPEAVVTWPTFGGSMWISFDAINGVANNIV